MRHLAFVLALACAGLAAAAEPRPDKPARVGGIVLAEQATETFELGPGHRVRIRQDGRQVETSIGDPVPAGDEGRRVVRTTRVGSNVNIATGRGAVACSQIGGRESCVINDGRGSRIVEGEAAAEVSAAIEGCFGRGSLAEIVACAERLQP